MFSESWFKAVEREALGESGVPELGENFIQEAFLDAYFGTSTWKWEWVGGGYENY